MLRHYDALGLLPPAEVDPFSGYRHYRPGQLPRAHELVAFKELGFGLEQVRSLLDGATPDQVRAALLRRRDELAGEIARDTARLAAIERRLRLIEGDTKMEFTLTSLPGLRLAQLTGVAAEQAEIGAVISPLFERLVAAYDGRLPGPPLAWYAGDGDTVRLAAAVPEDGDVPAGIEMGSLGPAERAVTAIYRGSVSGLGDAWQMLGAYVAAHGHEPVGPCRELYHEIHVDGLRDEVVELQQPIS